VFCVVSNSEIVGGTCGGGSRGNGFCASGACCSEFGFCGTTPEFCNAPTVCGAPPPSSSDCDILDDTCPFTLDLQCDDPSGLNLCPSNSDCFDCDPFFQQFQDQGCDACVLNGGQYCETVEGEPVCSSPNIAALAPNACSGGGGTPYMSTCSDPAPPEQCDLLNDFCQFALDLECDAGTFCPGNSDCFDCDPLMQFRGQGCDACIANGGQYCETAEGIPVCSDPAIAAQAPNACLGGGGTPYLSTCSTSPAPSPASPPAGGGCSLLGDPCSSASDMVCDAGTTCPDNSDCFDCDPLQQFRDQGCEACVANGGQYCVRAGGTPICSSPDIADLLPTACLRGGGTPYMSSCGCNILNDTCSEDLQRDFVCDDPNGENLCPANSDCFDCDPFQQFREDGCEACVNNGGQYCETAQGVEVCSSPAIADLDPNACLEGGGTPYTSSCNAGPTLVSPTVSPGPDGGGSSRGGLAALSVLALIPIVAIGYVLYRKRSSSGSHGKREGAEDPTETNSPEAQFNQTSQRPWTPNHEGSAAATRVPRDPPSDPVAVVVDAAPPFKYEGPDVKDQCRSAIRANQSTDPPLTEAIAIKSSNGEPKF